MTKEQKQILEYYKRFKKAIDNHFSHFIKEGLIESNQKRYDCYFPKDNEFFSSFTHFSMYMKIEHGNEIPETYYFFVKKEAWGDFLIAKETIIGLVEKMIKKVKSDNPRIRASFIDNEFNKLTKSQKNILFGYDSFLKTIRESEKANQINTLEASARGIILKFALLETFFLLLTELTGEKSFTEYYYSLWEKPKIHQSKVPVHVFHNQLPELLVEKANDSINDITVLTAINDNLSLWNLDKGEYDTLLALFSIANINQLKDGTTELKPILIRKKVELYQFLGTLTRSEKEIVNQSLTKLSSIVRPIIWENPETNTQVREKGFLVHTKTHYHTRTEISTNGFYPFQEKKEDWKFIEIHFHESFHKQFFNQFRLLPADIRTMLKETAKTLETRVSLHLYNFVLFLYHDHKNLTLSIPSDRLIEICLLRKSLDDYGLNYVLSQIESYSAILKKANILNDFKIDKELCLFDRNLDYFQSLKRWIEKDQKKNGKK